MKIILINMFSCFLTILGYFYIFSILNNNKIKLNFSKIIILILLTLATYFLNCFYIILIKFLGVFLILFLLYYLCVEKKFSEAIVTAFIIFMINSIVDWFYSILLSKFLISYFNKVPDYVIFNIYSLFLVFFIIILIKIKFIKKIINNLIKIIINIQRGKRIVYMILFCTFYIFVNALCLTFYYKEDLTCLTLIFFLSCTFIFIIFQMILYKNKRYSNKIGNLFKLNSIYGGIIEEDKIFKHNIKNKLLAIKNIGDENVKKLVNNILNDTTSKYNISVQLEHIPLELIGTIGDKLFNCSKTNIIINNQLKKSILQYINLKKYYVFCECLGIILDNAVEAVENLKNGYICIDLLEQNNKIEIVVKNNFKSIIDINHILDKNYSTKKNGTGIGLYSLSKQKNIKLNYIIRDNEFIVQIYLNKKAR